jgi:antitoxin component HigA of HigAB toxin-antitoxin module
MNLKEITSTRQYKLVLQKIESLMNAQKGTLEGGQLDKLVTIIENYESKRLVSCFVARINNPVK